MSDIALARPRTLHASRPVRIVLTGGFLGAGKTTALGALACAFRQRGQAVGFVTNDQAANLVDTTLVREQGWPVAEVAGGCFCCRFTDPLEAAQSVLDQEPDVLLCEPVDSCTDMVATVLNPLRLFYKDVFRFAPFTVLADPERVRQAVLGDTRDPFPPEVGYIFRKQLEEADLLALNKVDTLSEREADRLASALGERYGKPVLRLSARRGDGIEEWLSMLLAEGTGRALRLRDIDYDTYARGEAVLGWLNATAQVRGQPVFDASRLLDALMTAFRQGCADRSAEVAHMKMSLSGPDGLVRANLTQSGEDPHYGGSEAAAWRSGTLLLNARAHLDPDTLGALAVKAVGLAAGSAGARIDITSLQSFSPGYPRPPCRMADAS